MVVTVAALNEMAAFDTTAAGTPADTSNDCMAPLDVADDIAEVMEV